LLIAPILDSYFDKKNYSVRSLLCAYLYLQMHIFKPYIQTVLSSFNCTLLLTLLIWQQNRMVLKSVTAISYQ